MSNQKFDLTSYFSSNNTNNTPLLIGSCSPVNISNCKTVITEPATHQNTITYEEGTIEKPIVIDDDSPTFYDSLPRSVQPLIDSDEDVVLSDESEVTAKTTMPIFNDKEGTPRVLFQEEREEELLSQFLHEITSTQIDQRKQEKQEKQPVKEWIFVNHVPEFGDLGHGMVAHRNCPKATKVTLTGERILPIFKPKKMTKRAKKTVRK